MESLKLGMRRRVPINNHMIDDHPETAFFLQMKQVCERADKLGMRPTHLSNLRRTLGLYADGSWVRFDVRNKAINIQSIDNEFYGDANRIDDFYDYFTSDEDREILTRFTSLLGQFDKELRLELDRQRRASLEAEPVAKSEATPATPLTASEKELSAILNSLSISPAMGGALMVACVFFKNMLANGGWSLQKPVEKLHHLTVFDPPQIRAALATLGSGPRISMLIEQIKWDLHRGRKGDAGGRQVP